MVGNRQGSSRNFSKTQSIESLLLTQRGSEDIGDKWKSIIFQTKKTNKKVMVQIRNKYLFWFN